MLLLLQQVSVLDHMQDLIHKCIHLMTCVNEREQIVGLYGIIDLVAGCIQCSFFQCSKAIGDQGRVITQAFQCTDAKCFWECIGVNHGCALSQHLSYLLLSDDACELHTQLEIMSLFQTMPQLFLFIWWLIRSELVVATNHFELGFRICLMNARPDVLQQDLHALAHTGIIHKLPRILCTHIHIRLPNVHTIACDPGLSLEHLIISACTMITVEHICHVPVTQHKQFLEVILDDQWLQHMVP